MLSNTATPKEYAKFREAVMNGDVPVNKEISMQMNRIDADIANPDFYYDEQAMDGYVAFCENELTLTDGSDLILLPTFKLWAEDVLSWFEFVDSRVFNPRTERYEIIKKKKRLRNIQYLIVARGASKSLYQSTHQAYGLIVDTNTTVGITTAPTMKQSEEIMQPIETAIARARGPVFRLLTQGSVKSRNYQSQAKLAPTKKGIINSLTNSRIEVRPMRVDKLQGARSKYNTIDEWLSCDIKEDVINALKQGAAKGGNDDYLIFAVSSEGNVRDKVGDTIKLHLLKILRGEIYDPHMSIFYYRLDDIDEVNDPNMWMKAQPNIGVTVSYETYQQDVQQMVDYPSSRNDILAKRFGIPVEGSTYFFTYEETLLHPYQNYDHQECSMGMDASQGDDFWAFTFLFPLGNMRYGVKTRSYVSEIKYRKLPSATQMKYDQLVEEGTLVVMRGAILDWLEVYDDMDEFIMLHDYNVVSFGYDPYNAADFVDKWAQENGSVGIEKVRQGVKTESVPLGDIKNLSWDRCLIFDEELMKYAMGNTVVLQDNNGNYKLSKKRADEKIDNVAALMDSWVAYKRNQEAFM